MPLDRHRPTVVYAVTSLARDQRYLNNASYSDPWYYVVQTSIVDVLVQQHRVNVILKLFPGPPEVTGPIAQYAEDQAAPNLRISRHPFVAWLPWATRVILDFPSTALYEAAVARLPLLCLLYKEFDDRPEALQEIKEWTAWFEDPADAAAATLEFLNLQRPPAATLEPASADIVSTLEGLATSAPTAGQTQV